MQTNGTKKKGILKYLIILVAIVITLSIVSSINTHLSLSKIDEVLSSFLGENKGYGLDKHNEVLEKQMEYSQDRHKKKWNMDK